MTFIFTFLLIASLEIASGNNNPKDDILLEAKPQEDPKSHKDSDICVGCDDKEEELPEPEPPQLTIEIVIDPLTGNVQYIIKGIEIE